MKIYRPSEQTLSKLRNLGAPRRDFQAEPFDPLSSRYSATGYQGPFKIQFSANQPEDGNQCNIDIVNSYYGVASGNLYTHGRTWCSLPRVLEHPVTDASSRFQIYVSVTWKDNAVSAKFEYFTGSYQYPVSDQPDMTDYGDPFFEYFKIGFVEKDRYAGWYIYQQQYGDINLFDRWIYGL